MSPINNLTSQVAFDQNVFRFANKHEIAELTGLSHETLKRYRLDQKWIEGIHWVRLNPRTVRYNVRLILDWMQNAHNPKSHIRAIETYIRSLPSHERDLKRQLVDSYRSQLMSA